MCPPDTSSIASPADPIGSARPAVWVPICGALGPFPFAFAFPLAFAFALAFALAFAFAFAFAFTAGTVWGSGIVALRLDPGRI
jgi:hypothetical protein